MRELLEFVDKVADSDSTILILGESGTGKELIARTIHYNSDRRDQPLVPVNCGAIPENFWSPNCSAMKKAPLPER